MASNRLMDALTRLRPICAEMDVAEAEIARFAVEKRHQDAEDAANHLDDLRNSALSILDRLSRPK